MNDHCALRHHRTPPLMTSFTGGVYHGHNITVDPENPAPISTFNRPGCPGKCLGGNCMVCTNCCQVGTTVVLIHWFNNDGILFHLHCDLYPSSGVLQILSWVFFGWIHALHCSYLQDEMYVFPGAVVGEPGNLTLFITQPDTETHTDRQTEDRQTGRQTEGTKCARTHTCTGIYTHRDTHTHTQIYR